MNNNKRQTTLAIDLGTTNCVCSYVKEDGQIEIIPNKDGGLTTPSFIHVKQKGLKIATTVGEKAKAMMKKDPVNVLSSYKTYMGTKETIKTVPVLGKITALHCSYLMLKYLKESAEQFLDVNINGAVITVPAYFDESQKSATKLAAKMAGLTVDKIVNEPTAATFYYGLESKSQEPKTILAYDLGGGTFDVSIIQVIEDTCVVIGTAGDNRLGGDDIDTILLEYFLEQSKISIGKNDNDYREKLQRITEEAKIELCDKINNRNEVDASVDVYLPSKDNSTVSTITLTRAKFEELIDPIMDRTMLSVDKAMDMANIDISEIDEIILVGGSTKIPYIRTVLSKHVNDSRFDADYFSKYQLDPDLAVGLGAGMFLKYLLEDKLSNLTDIVTKSIGIENSDGQLITLLNVGRVLPASKSKTFVNSFDNQDCFNLNIYEGESCVASRNTKLGTIVIPIPPSPKGATQVMVKCTMGTDGTLRVQAIAGESMEDIEIQREYDEELLSDEQQDNKSTSRIKSF